MVDHKSREQRIREEAHLLCNADGCPGGKAVDYGLAAEKVIDHQDRLVMEEDRRGAM